MRKSLEHGVLFDLVGTLAYLEQGAYLALKREFASKLHISIPLLREAWSASRRLAYAGLFSTTHQRIRWVCDALKLEIDGETTEQLATAEDDMWSNKLFLRKGAKECLAELREAACRIAIVSNGPITHKNIINSLSLSNLIDVFVLSAEVGAVKPERAIYDVALQRLRLSPTFCVYVGDGHHDEFVGAKTVGLSVVRVATDLEFFGIEKWGDSDQEIFVQSLQDLPSQIFSLLKDK